MHADQLLALRQHLGLEAKVLPLAEIIDLAVNPFRQITESGFDARDERILQLLQRTILEMQSPLLAGCVAQSFGRNFQLEVE